MTELQKMMLRQLLILIDQDAICADEGDQKLAAELYDEVSKWVAGGSVIADKDVAPAQGDRLMQQLRKAVEDAKDQPPRLPEFAPSERHTRPEIKLSTTGVDQSTFLTTGIDHPNIATSH